MANAVSNGVVVPDAVPEESSRSATNWGPVIAGGKCASVGQHGDGAVSARREDYTPARV